MLVLLILTLTADLSKRARIQISLLQPKSYIYICHIVKEFLLNFSILNVLIYIIENITEVRKSISYHMFLYLILTIRTKINIPSIGM